MSIKVRDHKMLWGRASARCSFCRIPLATISDIGLASVIGEEAHIVARNASGPRGESPLGPEQRDSYSNLILLCPTHHAVIDDLPNGPAEYPVDLLRERKEQHENWVMSLDSFDANFQRAEEQWATIIDELDKRMSWNSWTEDMSLLFSFEQWLANDVYERLKDAYPWILSRIWPPGHEYLRDTIRAMGRVLNDLLVTFESHMKERRVDSSMWQTSKFYKEALDSKTYDALLKEYEFHTALVEDLCFELTRYGNLVASAVRVEIDSMYRFDEGVLLIRYGIDIFWNDTTYRPEFTAQELEGGRKPYTSLTDFLNIRPERELSEANVSNPRTAAGRQDPTKWPE